MEFVYEALPVRVIFGAGRRRAVRAEAERLGSQRALVLSTPTRTAPAQEIADLLGARCAGLCDGAVMHVPVERVTSALDQVRAVDADLLVAPGGGSTIGLAKALALETGLPILALPTTYAGSEMTPIWGLTQAGYKRTGRDAVVKPRTVIYDPELLVTLPATPSLTSGINALAHAVEALYAVEANPITALLATESIHTLIAGLPQVVQTPGDLTARGQTLYGAWLAGTVLGSVSMALHHKLCHTVGGSFNLPHAETHTVLLPHVLAYNAVAAPVALHTVARALGGAEADGAGALFDWIQHHGGPTTLADLGFPAAAIDQATHLATQQPYPNPRPVTSAGIHALLTAAWHGRRPTPRAQ
jgi:maleylacetate reductase